MLSWKLTEPNFFFPFFDMHKTTLMQRRLQETDKNMDEKNIQK